MDTPYVRAVIADEHEKQAVRAAQTGQIMAYSLGVHQGEVGGWPAKDAGSGFNWH